MKYEISELQGLNIEVRGGETIVTLNGKQIVLTDGEKLDVAFASDETASSISAATDNEPQVSTNVANTVISPIADEHFDDYFDSGFKRRKADDYEEMSSSTGQSNAAAVATATIQQAYDGKAVDLNQSRQRSVEKADPSDDFKQAFKIAVTNFRNSEKIFKSLRNVWYDKELQAGIHRVDGTGLTYLICILGAAIIMLLGSQRSISTPVTAAIIAVWFIVDICLINPLLIYISAPKPIKAHIRQIDRMTPEERKIYEEDIAENKMVKRMLRRYDEKGQFIYKEKEHNRK